MWRKLRLLIHFKIVFLLAIAIFLFTVTFQSSQNNLVYNDEMYSLDDQKHVSHGEAQARFGSPHDEIDFQTNGEVIRRKDAILKAKIPRRKARLAIGTATVSRSYKGKKASYIQDTLHSLLRPLKRDFDGFLMVIVLITDRKAEVRFRTANALQNEFGEFIDRGILHLIKTPNNYYRSLVGSVNTFNDSAERVMWRAKQVLDFSFLFEYAYGLSDYYMHIEDDVFANPLYLSTIQSDLKIYNTLFNWTMLDYSGQGFIGKLIRNSHLPVYSNWMKSVYQEMPCDWSMTVINQLTMGTKFGAGELKKILFFHKGTLSSSAGT